MSDDCKRRFVLECLDNIYSKFDLTEAEMAMVAAYLKILYDGEEMDPEKHPELLTLLQAMIDTADESKIKDVIDENGDVSGVSVPLRK